MTSVERVAPKASHGDGHADMTEKGRALRTLVEADFLDDRYETTQRGLKNRHVQLMALGGTIGTGRSPTLRCDICQSTCFRPRLAS